MALDDHSKHFVGAIAQKALIEKDGKILLVQYPEGDMMAGTWDMPGGRLHAGEAPVDGITREIKEELGLNIKNVVPFRIEPSFHYKSNMHQVFIAYKCTCDDATLVVDPIEVEEWKWVTRGELKVLPMFDDCRLVVAALVAEMV